MYFMRGIKYMKGNKCNKQFVLYILYHWHCTRAQIERGLSQSVHGMATYKCDDTRDCVIQFCPPDDEHMCSKHVEAWNKFIIKFSASGCLILINKYIEMHGQQNIKKKVYLHSLPPKRNKCIVNFGDVT